MAGLLAGCVCLCLLGCVSGQGLFSDCPSAMNTGSVGSCMISSCSLTRGPTHCRFGGCYCNDGSCRYPASTVHVQSRYCVQRVPGATCHLTRFCYSAGFSTSFCEKGLCMCKFGYVVDADNKCVPATSELAEAVARNATKDDIELLMEHKEHSERMAAQNVAVGTAWLCGAATLVFAAGAWALRGRASKVAAQPADYQVLVD